MRGGRCRPCAGGLRLHASASGTGDSGAHLVFVALNALPLLLLALLPLAVGEPPLVTLEPLDKQVLLAQLRFELGLRGLRRGELPLERRVRHMRGKCLSTLFPLRR